MRFLGNKGPKNCVTSELICCVKNVFIVSNRFKDIAAKSKDDLLALGFPQFTIEDFHETVCVAKTFVLTGSNGHLLQMSGCSLLRLAAAIKLVGPNVFRPPLPQTTQLQMSMLCLARQ